MARVSTVTGPISPEQLGVTMSHVHLMCNFLFGGAEPPKEASRRKLSESPITMDILGVIRRDAGLVKANMILDNVDEAIAELMFYKMAGGTSLVECSLPGTGRDLVALSKISRATVVNIICSSGWYVAGSHPSYVKGKSVDDLAAIIVGELTRGIGTTGIKTGAIKVALSGTSKKPFIGDEEKVLRAVAHAQAKTGAALNIHPNFAGQHWHTYLDILKAEGANLSKCCANHMEMFCPDIEYQKSVLERGVYISYDQFGHEQYFDSMAPGWGFKPDSTRVEFLLQLIRAGYTKRIVLSNETAFKSCYKKYGGYGYAHVVETIVPELRFKGVTEEQLNIMLVENMKELLAF
jgi:phosphotriesterase-related protein